MTIAAVSTSSLSALISAFAPERYDTAINLASPLFASGLIEKEDVDGKEIEVTLLGGANASTSWVADNGTLPLGMAPTPVIARAMPAFLVSKITMGRGASIAKLSDSQLSGLFDATLEQAAEHCGQVLGRSLHGGSTSPQAGTTWSSTAANATATVNFLDVSLFRPGASYDFLDLTSVSFVVRCTEVTPATVGANSDAVAGSASFINDIPNPATSAVVVLTDTTIAVGDSFRARGETAGFGGALTLTGADINSFDDMAGSSPGASFMGVTSTAFPGWRGANKSIAAAYSQEAVVAFLGRMHVQSGVYPNVAVLSPQLVAAHIAATGVHGAVFGQSNTISAARPMPVDKSADKFGNVSERDGLKVGGASIVQDPNCIATRAVFFHNSKTKIGIWKKMGPVEEAGDPVFISRTAYQNEAIVDGGYQLYTSKRASVGILDGFTGL